ncbi:hypothetical protein LINGRAHAP2_LOCUS12152 [Linum grandiflorum]
METSIQITSDVLGGPDNHAQVCLTPGTSGTYNVACNRTTVKHSLPGRLEDLLGGIRSKYIDIVPHPTTFCLSSVPYGDGAIEGFGYAFCDDGASSTGSCSDCLQSAIQVIVSKCDDGAVGAQASSDGCCIRYESYPVHCAP